MNIKGNVNSTRLSNVLLVMCSRFADESQISTVYSGELMTISLSGIRTGVSNFRICKKVTLI